MRFLVPLALVTAALAVVSCGDSGSAGDGRSEVVATTTQVADFARNVGGARVDVHQVLQPNSDPHEYEPRPSDALAVADASLVIRSGGDVDGWMDDVIGSAGGDARQLTLIDQVRVREGGHGHEDHAHEEGHPHEDVDPHWWQDPRNAELAVRAIRDELIAVDPGGRADYDRNAARYLDRLAALDRSTAACVDQLPRGERKIVTTHDALGYYAARYGLDVIGAVIPSLSTQAQPSAKDVQELVEQIESTRVKAIFPESSLNPKLEEAVARESGAATGAPLWADSLGPKGSSGATYIGSIEANTEAIVHGLSGGKLRCAPPA